jgi:hypothetical protein
VRCRSRQADYASGNDKKSEEAMLKHLWLGVFAAPMFVLGLSVPAAAVELDPAALVYRWPDQIKWSAPSPAGSQNAVLAGDPAKPGL